VRQTRFEIGVEVGRGAIGGVTATATATVGVVERATTVAASKE